MSSKSGSDKAAEKSNFAQKCHLLGQFLKEKGSFGSINLGVTGKAEAKASILPVSLWSEKKSLSDMNPRQNEESSDVKSIDLNQKLCRFGPSTSSRDTGSQADFGETESVPEPGDSQLTIFFSGKVIVFNEFPADKAKEIMDLAKQANSSPSCGSVSNSTAAKTDTVFGRSMIPDLNVPSTSGNNDNQQTPRHQLVERIARRVSLHRFFAKRKDRAAARAPYQVNHNVAFPPKPDEASQLLEEGQPSCQVKNSVVAFPPKSDEASPLLEEGESSRQVRNKPEEQNDLLLEEDQCCKHLELRL